MTVRIDNLRDMVLVDVGLDGENIVTDATAVELATGLTLAWLSNPSTRANADDVQAFVTLVNDTLADLIAKTSASQVEVAAPPEHAPAVSVRKSLASPDHIISMIDGRPYKTLRRHLSANGLTPDEYRARYNLRADYPMVAPGYSQSRRETAKRLGLGRKPAEAAPDTSERKAGAGKRAGAGGPAVTADPSERSAKPRVRRSGADARAAAKKHLGG